MKKEKIAYFHPIINFLLLFSVKPFENTIASWHSQNDKIMVGSYDELEVALVVHNMLFLSLPFYLRPCISITGCVLPLVDPSVRQSVSRSIPP